MTTAQKTHTATILALALALALAIALGHKEGWRFSRAAPQQPPSPQDTVYRMFDAARTGNVSAYLASYTDALEASLRGSVRESGEAAFATYLQNANAAIRGAAVGEPQPEGDGEVSVRVEYIYQDRNEAQVMHLKMVSGTWRIARVEGAGRVPTLVPYGTPVR